MHYRKTATHQHRLPHRRSLKANPAFPTLTRTPDYPPTTPHSRDALPILLPPIAVPDPEGSPNLVEPNTGIPDPGRAWTV
ncbi:hypothetical protein EW146_g2413 [Bondarzewia mesenterica]|uniref:Uncharacterized protein n=1 Tax=Bondarzewia mesenterica TaxID=1095465 RepID=A0A4S4M2L8_9AGAM|nr:hypothetical protein EW146_g2413 [Bondarzewia mesenterica]